MKTCHVPRQDPRTDIGSSPVIGGHMGHQNRVQPANLLCNSRYLYIQVIPTRSLSSLSLRFSSEGRDAKRFSPASIQRSGLPISCLSIDSCKYVYRFDCTQCHTIEKYSTISSSRRTTKLPNYLFLFLFFLLRCLNPKLLLYFKLAICVNLLVHIFVIFQI